MRIYISLIAASILQHGLFSAQGSENHSSHIIDLSPYIVSGSATPKTLYESISPASVLGGELLAESIGSTLGDTLDQIAGVSASGFSAGASRPVIRGFDGPRVKLMADGVEIADVSSTSSDHATSIEPYFAKSVEVIRGPATLLYGSSAIGGVVNVIDSRTDFDWQAAPVSGKLFSEYKTASEGYSVGVLSTARVGRWSVTASFLNREYGDYDIPVHAESDELIASEGEAHVDEVHESKLLNSFVDNRSYSLSSSWFYNDTSRLSLTWIEYDSLYGVPGHSHGDEHHHDEHEESQHEEDADHEHEHEEEGGVKIDLNRKSLRLDWEHTFDGHFVNKIVGKATASDYDHIELEGDEIGTVFENRAKDLNLLGHFNILDNLPGVMGYQFSRQKFNAVGEEAFTPASETTDQSLYLLQEWSEENFRVEGGFRLENRKIDAENVNNYKDTAVNASLGANYQWTDALSLSVSAQHSKRHPTSSELFAKGAHLATGQYEIGDSELGIETARSLDVSLKMDNSWITAQVTAYAIDFEDYIYLSPKRQLIDGLPVFMSQAENAVFKGVEAELTWHALHLDTHQLHLSALYDFVDAELDSGDRLPRIPPQRFGIKTNYQTGGFNLGFYVIHALKQDEVSLYELPTSAYTNVDFTLGYHLNLDAKDWAFSVKIRNLFDEEIRYHTSSTKDIAPLAGRSLVFSISTSW